ncbi:MAG: TetR family transcriptional regulator [Gemmatimonas sp.]|nr:TetR family transcriptional regulator [Gemmatimonas sp.]
MSPTDVQKVREDPRVLRTRRTLGASLVELMKANRFDEITVQQVLDRASVGRATFYSHFRNKRDLLLSDAERFFIFLEQEFLAQSGASRRVAPVEELFGHVADVEHFRVALERSSMREPVYDLLTGHLAGIIERRLTDLGAVGSNAALPITAVARMLAAALVEMMRWWLTHPGDGTAREMDVRFHRIAWGGITRVSPRLELPRSI